MSPYLDAVFVACIYIIPDTYNGTLVMLDLDETAQ